MSEHDDMSEWRDDPLVRALRAPGSPTELSGEREMVTAYRQAMPRRSVGRMVGRFGVGGSAVVTAVALSSGVAAAAYTQTLPEPVQRIAHDVLGPIGVPPAHEPKVKAQPQITKAPSPTPTPTPTAPTATPGVPVPTGESTPRTVEPAKQTEQALPPKQTKPTKSPDAVVPPAGPSSSPSPSPSPAPTPTPTPSDPPVVRVRPASLSISVSASMVSVGASVTVSGAVTGEDGTLLANRRVALVGRTPGRAGWDLLASGRTGEGGSIALSTPPLAHNLVLKLRTSNRVTSDPVRVAVVPTIGVAYGDGTLSVETYGGQAGDIVVLLRWREGRLVRVGRAELDASGAASFAVEQKKKAVRYVVHLKGSKLHTPVEATITVPGDPGE